MLIEGKTKTVQIGPQENTVLLVAKDALTGGDAAKKEEILQIGRHKTAQAAHAFRTIEAEGIPTAFIDQFSEDSLLCDACDMLPLEFVVRRYAWGSYLKRNPGMKTETGKPHRFDLPVWELFHKHSLITPPAADTTTMMAENDAREHFLKDGTWAEGVYTDPYIELAADGWGLHNPKAPINKGEALYTVKPTLTDAELENAIYNIVMPAFQALESAWLEVETQHGPVHLADIKFELGHRKEDGQLVLADVVDNDSWRIWPGGKPDKQLDKQCFRDGNPLSQISENYALVTELTSQFTENR